MNARCFDRADRVVRSSAIVSARMVLMNARGFDHADLAELAKRKTGVFVGVVLQARESRLLTKELDAACAAAAAFIGGRRRKRQRRRRATARSRRKTAS